MCSFRSRGSYGGGRGGGRGHGRGRGRGRGGRRSFAPMGPPNRVEGTNLLIINDNLNSCC